MLKKLILFVFLSISISVSAHQPEVSTTMLVEKENNMWILQISASLTAFQQEVQMHFPEYKTPEEFQTMVLEHIKNNLEITFNGNQSIRLNSGVVKLGHETKVVFEVFGVPSEITSIVFKNSAFKDIYNNQNALMVFKEGFDKQRFVLNNKNNHILKLITDQDKLVLESSNQASFISFKMFVVLLVILSVGLISKIIISRNE